jgi:hypothetical protein
MKRTVPGVRTTYETIENKRNIDGKPSRFQREFELVFVIDASVEISWFILPQNSNVSVDCGPS